MPAPVARYLARLRRESKPLSRHKTSAEELKTFGIFLGGFAHPTTPSQARVLSQWDVLVLNPLQERVLDALSTCQPTSSHVLGRLDVRTLTESDSSSNSDDVIRLLGVVAQTLSKYFKNQHSLQSPFTGVLLAGFQTHFQPAVLNEMAKYINGLGLDLWLEMSPPAYLTERECREINMKMIRGLVCRNGTIRPDGDRQNYFQMTEMRTAMRAVAAQRVRHGPPIMMWETVDDGVELQYAVVQRSFDWCRYNSALCWIGPTAALTDAEAAPAQTVANKPLGALMWLKGDDIMKAHNVWRSNNQVRLFTENTGHPLNSHLAQISLTSCGHDALYDSLHSFIPDVTARLRLLPPDNKEQAVSGAQIVDRLDWLSQTHHDEQTDPLSVSASGDNFTGLGCFHLGLEVGPKDVADILQTQRHLKDLNLLQCIQAEELRRVADKIRGLCNAQSSSEISSAVSQVANELLDLLTTRDDDGHARLQIYVGLHSGFQTRSEVQFWGVSDVDASRDVQDIYISGKTQDRAATILHTFLSSRGCTRTECFMAELAMSRQNGGLSETWQLPPRIVRDVEQLTPAETILFLRRLILSRHKDHVLFLTKIRACCEYQLMDVPTLNQLRALSSTAYLGGKISAESLVTSRLDWLRERGAWCPDPSAAISLFEEVDARLHGVLMSGQTEILSQLGVVIQAVMQKDQIDAGADMFALSVFSAFRKLALDEVYLEVLDRNPYPNHTTDQAGCFAENFALGSRCDSFFDMTPRSLGRIISDRYRAYYMKHQPPRREEGFTELPTAYAAMQVDLDPQDGQEKLPTYYQITFLGIFAVPALIDIMLLTTIGRGLYLTTFMNSTEKKMATTALMFALLVCGAVGSWISSGGCYYLYASAFPAMNMFVLTRFVAGIAIVLVGGLAGMVANIVLRGVTAGLVFFFYFAMLTTYLLTLSALSIYQVPGSRFQSVSTSAVFIPLLFLPLFRLPPKIYLLTKTSNF